MIFNEGDIVECVDASYGLLTDIEFDLLENLWYKPGYVRIKRKYTGMHGLEIPERALWFSGRRHTLTEMTR